MGNLEPELNHQSFQFADPGDDIGIDSAFDAAGNAYVTGTTYGSMPGYANLGSCDCFISKYNISGVQQWVRQFGSSGMDIFRDLRIWEREMPLFLNIILLVLLHGFDRSEPPGMIFSLDLKEKARAGVTTWV